MESNVAHEKEILVSAVVVTYNRRDLLQEVLQALYMQSRKLDEIIVIDNASSDGTEELIALKFPQITYVKLEENIGGAGGFYAGIKMAYEKLYDWIWVMDDDVKPVENALETLLSFSKIDNNVLGLVPCRKDMSGKKIGAEGVINANMDSPIFFEEVDLSSEYVWINQFTFEGPLFKRKGIQLIGLPDPAYFILYDDIDYGYRLSQAGNIYYIRDAVFVKMLPVDASLTNASQWKWYYRWRNFFYFIRKNLGWKSIRKIWPWLNENGGVMWIRNGVRARKWERGKFIIIILIALVDSFFRMGRRYLPGEEIIPINSHNL